MWVRAGVVMGLSVDGCSWVHVWVESLRTVGLDGDGLEVDVRPLELEVKAVVVVVVKLGPRVPKRWVVLFWVT